jgi:hypothetical protein
MTNADRIVVALRGTSGLTDAELRRLTGIEPHQQVNQICRRLEAMGLLQRVQGDRGRIVNVLVDIPAGPTPTPTSGPPAGRGSSTDRLPSAAPVRSATPGHGAGSEASLDLEHGRTLIVTSCSADKAHGGHTVLTGPSVADLLPAALADRLRGTRATLAPQARVDESRLLPAWQRYTGHLHRAANPSLGRAIDSGTPVLILSGGYGLLHGGEPIGAYNRPFARRDWPPGLLEDCLATAAERLAADNVLAFCSRTTAYADVLRRVRWAEGVRARLVAPDMRGQGGAQVFVPRAAGEAIEALLTDRLHVRWTSSDGIPVNAESLA